MTEFISRKYGNDGYEVIIKTDSREHYKASEDFARRLIDHAKPVTKEQSWEDIGRGICQCTGCGHGIRQHMACVNKFCPNCGAPMKGRKEKK